MTREQAEATATMMYNIVAKATQPIVDRLDVMEKQIRWCSIENIVATCVIAIGYVGIVITLLLKL